MFMSQKAKLTAAEVVDMPDASELTPADRVEESQRPVDSWAWVALEDRGKMVASK